MSKYNLPLLIGVLAFVIALGVFTVATDALAYAGTDAATCNNCHVMDAEYEGWFHAGHAKVAVCADCHLPHEFIPKYIEKARSGMNDVYVFVFEGAPERIHAGEYSKDIVQENCVACHEDAVESIMLGEQSFERYCWDCHRSVMHGERGVSITNYQDTNLYPIK
jgi:cytochrome c nitrite reductase small subunit